jgi:hypothetical protein
MNVPPLPNNIRKTDADQLRLLGIFHFVIAGFGLVGLGFIFLHRLIMQFVMQNPQALNMPRNGPGFPPEMATIFGVMYIILGVILVIGMACNAISGYLILQRKCRVFSLIIAGINCIHFPFGTALGVFTFIVLMRPSVRETYEAEAVLPQ